MSNKFLFIFVPIIILLFTCVAYAETCSQDGYTILAVNGIFTDENNAMTNAYALKRKVSSASLPEPIKVDYLYNQTHIGGALDLIDVIEQGGFNEKSDYDLIEMLNDASKKITTQKVLLVAHSQGNFYSNNFYDKVVNKDGGIPASALGVYSVATPAHYVAGGGKYLTSDTDRVIATVVGKYLNQKILPPNTHIDLKDEKGSNGHSFSDIYLKYRGDIIVSDIKDSLLKLKSDANKNTDGLCLSPQKISLDHKIFGVALNTTDSVVNTYTNIYKKEIKAKDYIVESVVSGVNIASKYIINKSVDLALSGAKLVVSVSNSIFTLGKNSLASVVSTLNLIGNNDKEKPTEAASDENQNDKIDRNILDEINQNNIEINTEIKQDENVLTSGVDAVNSTTTDSGPIVDLSNNLGGGGKSSNDGAVIIPKDENVTPPEDAGEEIPTPPVEEVDNTVYLSSDLNNNSIDDSTEENVVVSTNFILTAGNYKFNNLEVTNDSSLTLRSDPNSQNEYKGVRIKAKNITINEGSYFRADGEGYGPFAGPGASPDIAVGASYGGGGDLSYGNSLVPLDLGSGGVTKGGGAIYLDIKGTLTNNGSISSNGYASSSGGSVYVKTNKLSGKGIFSANGGGLNAAGTFTSPGDGGRVAVYYKESDFNGLCEAKPGSGSYDGWSATYSSPGTAGLFDVTKNNLIINSNWRFEENANPFNFNEIILTSGAKVGTTKNVVIKAKNLLMKDISAFNFSSQNQDIEISKIDVENGSILTLSKFANLKIEDLILRDRAILTTNKGEELNLNLNNLLIDETSIINVYEKGLEVGPGTPTGEFAGAVYGGSSVNIETQSKIYGSENRPIDMGSGGHGYHPIGGGAIRIIVLNKLINNGNILANGNNTSSGGSIYITSNILEGSGRIEANGGPSYCPNICFGSGGGGRIAIYYKTSSVPPENAVANGWNGYGGGSIYGTVKWIDLNLNPDPIPDPEPIPVLSSLKSITSFNFESLTPKVIGNINDTDHSINLTVPYGTDVVNLSPSIIVSEKANIPPVSLIVKDFTNPITYTVTAEDGSNLIYTVSVIVSPNPNPEPLPPDTKVPSVLSYTFNNVAGDITINPTVNNLTFSIRASESVNWMSIKIEKEDDSTVYKIFQSNSTTCKDGFDICERIWEKGLLSSGGLLQNGVYRIRLHMKDLALNDFYEYLSPYKITVQQ